ncbi:MAG: M23 family metallopeptidase [Elusimicrobia bacterium]|nr:M23 family metallopeptidase [Elusimicrobiota bacterium]
MLKFLTVLILSGGLLVSAPVSSPTFSNLAPESRWISFSNLIPFGLPRRTAVSGRAVSMEGRRMRMVLANYISNVKIEDFAQIKDIYRFPFRMKNRRVYKVSSSFGRRFHPILGVMRFHDGWDLARPYGTPVYPSRSGLVIFAGWKEGYGRMVEIQHPDRASTRYGHLSDIHVKVGQWVRQSQDLIGRVGSTGLSTGPHLHFEVRDSKGRPINPKRGIDLALRN